MVSNLGASSPFGEPGGWDVFPTGSGPTGSGSDFRHDTAEGSYNGPETVTEFITPTFDEGEIWALKIRCTLSSEPSDNIVVMELMDEDEANYIQKAVATEFGGNEMEINTVVDWQTAAFDSGASSPDLRITAVGADGGNYFIELFGIRLRRGDTTGALGNPPNALNGREEFDA